VLDIFDVLFFHPLGDFWCYRSPSHEERMIIERVRAGVLPILRANLVAFGVPEILVEHFLDLTGRFYASPFK
jgi:hypothetical protein